jgi:hypothetical protein
VGAGAAGGAHCRASVDGCVFRSDDHRVPEQPYSPTIDPGLVQKAAQWRNMNIIRVLLFMAVNLALLPLIHRVGKMLSASESRKA